jgi:ribosomal peptide maturation radical SAM protein 1
MTDILLVNMPFAALERPSLALGILSSILSSNKIDNRVLHANLLLCNHIKIEDYIMIEKSASIFGISDWIFSSLVFPDKNNCDDEYLDKLIYELELSGYAPPKTFRNQLQTIKRTAATYIDEIINRIIAQNPRIVGFSSTFQQHLPSLALLQRIREKFPEIITMMGGANCETVMGVATHRNFPFVDFVVSGEADDLIVSLVKAIVEKGIDISPDKIPYGVFAPFHRINGYPKNDQDSHGDYDPFPRAALASFAKVPIPDYDDYFATLADLPDLRQSLATCLPVESSRGCYWGKCKFCGLNGRNYGQTTKSVKQVVHEINELSCRYNLDRIEAVDNALPPLHIPDIFKELACQESKYRIFYEVRTSLKKDEIKAMSECGINWTQPGIESLHPKVLYLMKKGSPAWQSIQYLKWARQYGIRSIWKIMFDFPEEEDEWYEEMAGIIPLLFHLEPPDAINQIRYDRYSVYHEQAARYNLDLRPYPMVAFNYNLPEKELMDLFSFFEDEKRRKRNNNPVLSCLIGQASRSGLRKVKKTVKKWSDIFWGKDSKRPELLIVGKSPSVQIVDTRPVAVNSRHELNGLEAEIYLACDSAQKIDPLKEKITVNSNYSGNNFDKAVKSLISRHLLLNIDKRLLALALERPHCPFPKPTDYPVGYWVGAKPT